MSMKSPTELCCFNALQKAPDSHSSLEGTLKSSGGNYSPPMPSATPERDSVSPVLAHSDSAVCRGSCDPRRCQPAFRAGNGYVP